MFLSTWNIIVGSTTESEYWTNLNEFETILSTYPDDLCYLKRTLLDNYKEPFVVNAQTCACILV